MDILFDLGLHDDKSNGVSEFKPWLAIQDRLNSNSDFKYNWIDYFIPSLWKSVY